MYTEKEVLRRQIAALEREKHSILGFHALLVEKLRCLTKNHLKHKAGARKKKQEKIESPESRVYVNRQIAALKKYGSHINWKSVEHFLECCEEKKKLLQEDCEKPKDEKNASEPTIVRLPGCCGHYEVVKVKKLGRIESPKIHEVGIFYILH